MEEYSVGWWDLETCEYLKSRMARRKISTSYARHGVKIERLWGMEMHYVLNMLGATTGLRIGEILGLKGAFLHPDYIEVTWQFNSFKEFTETKTHDTRYVTIPALVAQRLQRLKEQNGDGYLFSTDGGATPLSRSAVHKHYQKALAKIGIAREEQTRRGLTFHKWRHFFNTTLRMGNVADSKVRELTGHKSGGSIAVF